MKGEGVKFRAITRLETLATQATLTPRAWHWLKVQCMYRKAGSILRRHCFPKTDKDPCFSKERQEDLKINQSLL